MERVDCTVENQLCIGCGICKAACPVHCIAYQENNGIYVPHIHETECVNCGICKNVCPGIGFDYTRYGEEQTDFWFGHYEKLYTAWSKDDTLRYQAVSGGVVTELVRTLLTSGEYESAFLIDTHAYGEGPVYTERITKQDSLDVTMKSRYVTVSQEKAIGYMLAHKEERLILVGTSCFVQGVLKVIDQFQLNREQYFIIGLFCDKTMTMNVITYFADYVKKKGKRMKEFFFRSKAVGGWPGGVLIRTEQQEEIALPNTERMKLKEYFQPERCLYCLDKLNQYADISVGDNYTGRDSEREGSNSVIIRTKRGLELWKKNEDRFACRESDRGQIAKSQHLSMRQSNAVFSLYKEKKTGIRLNEAAVMQQIEATPETDRMYHKRLRKIQIGQNYREHPYQLYGSLLPKNIKNRIRRMIGKRK